MPGRLVVRWTTRNERRSRGETRMESNDARGETMSEVRSTRRSVLKRAAALSAAAPALGILGGVAATRRASAQSLSGNLVLWHGWTGAEADTLNNDILPA